MTNPEDEDNSRSFFRGLISVGQAAKLSGFTPQHVRLLLRTGAIKGQKLGREWMTTEEVKAYMATERRTGPKTGEHK